MPADRYTRKGRQEMRRKEEALANARAQGLSQSANFGAPQQNAFSFGASAPAPANNGANGFGGNNAFGGGATNSFPPAQPAAPSNTFSSSSFPAFGGSSQGTGFNPTPPSSAGFNFTAGGANPFANANSAPATNGSTPAPAFGGSSMFGNNAQAQSNPFGSLGQNNTTSSAPSGGMFGTTSSTSSGGMFGTSNAAPSGGMFGTSSTAPSGGMFGTSSAAPSGGMFGTSSAAPSGGMFGTSSAAPSGMFGTTSGAPNATSTSAPASTPFTFGASTTSASSTASTPATSGMFSGFGSSAQPAAPSQTSTFTFGANTQKDEAPKQSPAPSNNMFGGFGSNAQKSENNSETSKQSNPFGNLGTSTQGTPSATATAPASNLFNFGATAQKPDSATSTAPSTNLFGTTSSAPSNPFANLPTTENKSSTETGWRDATAQKPVAEEKAAGTSSNLFSNLKKPEESGSGSTVSADTTKSNPFAALPKPASTPATTGSSSSFSLFGANKDTGAATVKAPEAPKSSLFQPFSTPQPAKTTDVEKSQGGMFTAAQPKTTSGLFSQTFQPESNNSSNLFKKPQSTSEMPKAAPAQSTTNEASNPFASLSKPSTDRPNLFSASEEPSQPSPTPAMSNLNGDSQASEMPKVPKVHVPKEWAVPGAVRAQSSDGLLKQISDLTAQLQVLNDKYRQQLGSLPLTADWSSVSLWHYQHASDIKKKIDNAKKQRAAGRGITGNESSLSTKRKVSDESPEVRRDPSPSKRARATEAPASPTPQLSDSTPKLNAPATATSNMFAKAIGNKPSTPAATSSTSLFAPKTAEKPATEPSKPAAPTTGFVFTPSAPTTNGSDTSSGFKPSFGGSSTSTSASTGFKPTFGGSSISTSGSAGFKPNFGSAPAGGFMAQFTKTAKTYEELAAERKKKAMDEDYDSDDETKEEWSARYDKAEAERLAKEKEIAASTKFVLPGAESSGSTSPKDNPFSGLLKPNSGASTSKAASPAPSTGSQSVFDATASQTSSPNIFGHLSGPSSNNQEESDEDDGEQQATVGSVEPATPPTNRAFGGSETESEDTQKQDTAPKGSLLSRMTKDTDSESERENSGASPMFGQTNGTTTPANKPFQFFDFGAASKTAPPKSDTFAGDQTFKVGTPIKFGQAPATEKKDAPKLNVYFQPATPAAGEFSTTPAKPPPASIFNFAPSTGGSSLFAPSGGNSVTSSVFSSRAGTPLSEAGETSAASAAEDDEEGGKQEQIDLTKLTEDELDTYDIVFHTEVVLAKHQEGEKGWTNIAKGPLWILKDKQTGKCSVRVRIPSGATPLNYQILPALPATVTGGSKKMVMATKPAKEGGLQSVLYAVKTPEIAQELAAKYTESVPKSQ
ncbi:uncharacterized protein ALTATR162_LOCUS7515 [Alternaria atra]|uniref:Nuclear pore complex NUP2/50/61 domain-containing protein n=1 Tax=Alternaria atra TaxID=119953 RepID=A0A8J2IDG0_9PLEO|nr:uncharacterized protein ALTATR162_LOCUS7515 [Alternaria atra]CAG5172719.1 unnamed protein product [Alternaria atra]